MVNTRCGVKVVVVNDPAITFMPCRDGPILRPWLKNRKLATAVVYLAMRTQLDD